MSQPDQIPLVQQGLVASVTHFSGAAGPFFVENSQVKDKLNSQPIFMQGSPGNTNTMTGLPRGDRTQAVLACINKAGGEREKEAVWDLMKWITSYEGQLGSIDHGNAPARKDVLATDKYKKSDPAWEAEAFGYQDATDWNTPAIGDLQNILAVEIGNFMVGKQTSKETTQNVWKKFDEALRRVS